MNSAKPKSGLRRSWYAQAFRASAQDPGVYQKRSGHQGVSPFCPGNRNAVGLRSSSTVHGHLTKLEELGYIRRDLSKPRAIELLDDALAPRTRMVNVPLVGKVTAGTPILAVENIEDYYPIPMDLVEHEDVFMLRVKGDSM